jgi:Flagella basal body rod protein
LTWRHKTPARWHVARGVLPVGNFCPQAGTSLPAPADPRGQITGKTQEWAWHDACCVLAAELRAGPPRASFAFVRVGEDVMGIFDALTTAVSGLQAQSFALQNISGNIANSQTVGYKETDTSFQDLVSAAAQNQQTSGGVCGFAVQAAEGCALIQRPQSQNPVQGWRALITRARASLISQFLEDQSATHLLFIDADIGFEPEQVVRLIECGADVCAAIYPIKRIDWDKVRSTIETARPNPAAASLKYVFEVDNPAAVTERSGFVRVRYAGTGFLMIRRGALERMCSHYPELRYRRDHSLDATTPSDHRFALFECMIGEDGTYLSEDFAFCKRWTDMGGEIWADLRSKLNHVGPMAFCGDLSSQFAGVGA